MVKYSLNFLLIFLMLTSFSWAKKDEDAKLKKEFGEDLTHVPYFLRFAFHDKYHKDWKETYYSERKSFLMDYETNLVIEQAKEKAEAQAEVAKEKARAYEKKEALRRERDRLKAQLLEEKSEKQADAERQKEFTANISTQEKELQQMERELSQERQSLRQ